jgi:hypothetical protein
MDSLILAGFYSLSKGLKQRAREISPEDEDRDYRIVKKLRFNEGMFPSDSVKLYLDGDIGDFKGDSDFLVGEGWGWLVINPPQRSEGNDSVIRNLQIVDYDIFVGDEGILLPKLSYFHPEERGYHGSEHFGPFYGELNPSSRKDLDLRVERAKKESLQLDENRINVGKKLVRVLESRLPQLSGEKKELCELLLNSQDNLGEKEKERIGVIRLDAYLG